MATLPQLSRTAVLAAVTRCDGEELIVAVNVGTEPAKFLFEVNSLKTQPQQSIYGSGEATWTDGLTLSLPARSGSILA
ncbi:MAG: hypothetical protein F6K32_00360 [Desertifilum sp. SIO1I2]|nr:hypothetical protein [Desertifilum sp. SIO1I2]